jgi:RNA polymerase sigma factor (sigma-70 family)
MDESELNSRISRIETIWTLVQDAHQAPLDEAMAAQEAVLRRYGPAIYRYLHSALRDPNAADEVFQEFALRFVQGSFRRADPERGRFRHFVKKALHNLILTYRQKQYKRPASLPDEVASPQPEGGQEAALDQEFNQRWRAEVLARTWEALARMQSETGKPFHDVLRFRASNPKMPSAQMAAELSVRLGKPLTDAGVRQSLHRAREKFAALLLDEVARSLKTNDSDRLREELSDLGLLPYCQAALDQRARTDQRA